jgi:hypothetical protein
MKTVSSDNKINRQHILIISTKKNSRNHLATKIKTIMKKIRKAISTTSLKLIVIIMLFVALLNSWITFR